MGLVHSSAGQYQKNAHGDIVQYLNHSGGEVSYYVFDAFGVQRESNIDSNDKNPFRYCSEYYEPESSSIYLKARNYIPGTGRFTQEDTHWNSGNMVYGDSLSKTRADVSIPSTNAIMQSGNLYAYCSNNPIAYSDPNGQAIHIALGALIGFTAGVVTNLAEQLISNGGDLNAVKFSKVWAAGGAGALTGGLAAATGGVSLVATAGAGALLGEIDYTAENLLNGTETTLGGHVIAAGTGALTMGVFKGLSYSGIKAPAVQAVAKKSTASKLRRIDDYVDLVDFRKAHILNRHRAGSGISGKTEFPRSWSDDRIIHNVSDIATDPNAVWSKGKWGEDIVTGWRDGIRIQVDFYAPNSKHFGKISTAFPLNTPMNP